MTDVTGNIPDMALSGLPPPVAAHIVKIMARISEASYRRGYQHHAVMEAAGRKCVDPEVFRFKASIDESPFPDTFTTSGAWPRAQGRRTALWRLGVEYGGSLGRVGLPVPDGMQ